MKELFSALSKAQGEIRDPELNATTKVRMKNGGEYAFKYATLGEVLKTVRPTLAKHGLSLAQVIEDGKLKTILGHASGDSLSSTYALPQTTDMQALGAAMTYLRRYEINAILGIFADEDDDANTIAPKTESFKVDEKKVWKQEPQNEFIFGFGKFKGKKLSEINESDLASYGEYLKAQPDKSDKAKMVIAEIEKFLGTKTAIQVKTNMPKITTNDIPF